ncbi:hypothetical protein, partial [Burkholderia multivorans]|uniref:hypothetical protein n=1 Tax=Burkholderia multivorans TaxID=87883 RepID=UPI0021BEB379
NTGCNAPASHRDRGRRARVELSAYSAHWPIGQPDRKASSRGSGRRRAMPEPDSEPVGALFDGSRSAEANVPRFRY